MCALTQQAAADVRAPAPRPNVASRETPWDLCLYLADLTPHAVAAINALQRVCEQRLAGKVQLQVIDLLEHPQQTTEEQLLTLPTLVRRSPPPLKKITGDLTSEERILVALDLPPQL